MKSKRSYQLLEQALRALPQEQAFATARTQMRKALTEMAEAEKKKTEKKSITPAEKWKLDLETATLSSPFTQQMQTQKMQVNPLDTIDNLIKDEQRKIDEIKKQQQKPSGGTIGGLFTG
jgi:3-methyladenine DNA glycosylase AlkC